MELFASSPLPSEVWQQQTTADKDELLYPAETEPTLSTGRHNARVCDKFTSLVAEEPRSYTQEGTRCGGSNVIGSAGAERAGLLAVPRRRASRGRRLAQDGPRLRKHQAKCILKFHFTQKSLRAY
jgi:hypothetical protein